MARCHKCHPVNETVSDGETEIAEFIRTIYDGEIIKNNRDVISPKELDIYLPDRKLAFEYDGLYWHSENMGTTPSYHSEKTDSCENAGIKLAHIFENEWMFKKEIVKGRISCMLGKYYRTIFARKCDV